jgi:2-octaprenylphenol hydroxylase
MKKSFDIFIVGGGLLGMISAIAFAKEGFSVAIIESQHDFNIAKLTGDFSGQTLAINRASENVLKNLNVWQELSLSRITAYKQMHVWDKHFTGNINFSAEEFGESNLGHIVEQRNLLYALSKVLLAQENIVTFPLLSVKSFSEQDSCISFRLANDDSFTAKVCIAADGANSWVRNTLNIPMKNYEYTQHALVAIVKGTKPHNDTAYQRFAKDGPLGLLPLAEKHTSSLIWSLDSLIANEMFSNEKEFLARKITSESEHILGDIEILSNVGKIPLIGSHAKQYYKSRCVLVGDSAHRVHPLAGLGANLGIMDVAQLVDVFCMAVKKKRDVGHDSVLARYQQKRWLANQIVVRVMQGFKQGFSSTMPFAQALRAYGLHWIDNKYPLKQFFAKNALGNLVGVPNLAQPQYLGS